MSRIGKKPVQIPEKVEVSVKGDLISIKGPKGSLDRSLHPAVKLAIENGMVNVSVTDDQDRKTVALQGLFRSLVANMITGVSVGYEKKLLLNGIGYRAEVNGNTVVLNVGYSNPVNFELPKGISALVEKNTTLSLSGIDKEIVGETAARIRRIRPPEPYKGKGIMYSDERIIKKAGKAAAK
ncbi:RplF [Desulforapulum autotrophicum HRM2]|uniref:Large ribosomal subunit protein uL6 n=1 Tax=Desulforapulum autotrophicum (strain ATCC 43914 / DSM 3382 / VKM B-1955 / HRM2) TaxID=177437 RepID=RL6_DESAH|nr:50S ribosomal protein L6 [Desulforapulum autotrophicum]C0Q9V8.1 RecName: Full=Large ribosomal subunit protein uL6; AltName: Full=50S ribosomal protein L6 [Desulforapulum autotrophicum HRM2]ACN16676.1 RplF [Desulforapulum autotrophicum HRM2]